MAHSEFHHPEHRDGDDEPEQRPVFKTHDVQVLHEEKFMKVDVIQYTGRIKLEGIFGMRRITVGVAREMIDALEEAIEFIQLNPPRAEFREN